MLYIYIMFLCLDKCYWRQRQHEEMKSSVGKKSDMFQRKIYQWLFYCVSTFLQTGLKTATPELEFLVWMKKLLNCNPLSVEGVSFASLEIWVNSCHSAVNSLTIFLKISNCVGLFLELTARVLAIDLTLSVTEPIFWFRKATDNSYISIGIVVGNKQGKLC